MVNFIKPLHFSRTFVLAIVLSLTACSSLSSEIKQIMADEAKYELPLQIFLVRHAEKKLDVKNPSLTPGGRQRSIELMKYLSDIEIDRIYSTDYKRTLETATPSADFFRLDIEHYNPRELETFADDLKSQFGVVLVVGHSNTTPQLVSLLGGEPGSEINEASEYDRLYHIIYKNNGDIDSQLIRYGKPYRAQEQIESD